MRCGVRAEGWDNFCKLKDDCQHMFMFTMYLERQKCEEVHERGPHDGDVPPQAYVASRVDHVRVVVTDNGLRLRFPDLLFLYPYGNE